MRAFGRHVVMNSVTGVILPNHGFAVSFNNVSACRYFRGVVSRQFSRSPRESNQISPPKYYSPHRLRSFFEREYKLEREDMIFVWRDEISISKRRGAEYLPPSLLHPQTWFTTFVFQPRRGSSSTALVPVRFIPATIKYIVHGFCIARPTIREIKNACAHRGGEGGNFCFFVVASKRIATYDAAMVNTGCNRDVIGQSCYRVAPWNRKKK